MEMCLVCLVLLPLLSMHIADSISNTIRGAYYGPTYGSLFNNSLFIVLELAILITAVHTALY